MQDPTQYDDERELAGYIWGHYSHLMTELERRVGMAWFAQAKQAAGSVGVAQFIRQRHKLDDPDAQAALADGIDAFRNRVVRRLLEESGNIFINRCPACGRIVCTPKARQCLWCGHDWHSRT